MRENEEQEFVNKYGAAYKKNILPKIIAQEQKMKAMQAPKQWKDMTLEERLETIAKLTVQHENALKEFGPVLGLVMQVLTEEGMLEKAESSQNGKKITQWRMKKDRKIMIQKKGEQAHEF